MRRLLLQLCVLTVMYIDDWLVTWCCSIALKLITVRDK